MIDFTQISELSQGKTRVILFGLHPDISNIIRYVLDYHDKNYDFVSTHNQNITGNDFFLLDTDDEQLALSLSPTIVFIGSHFSASHYEDIIQNITGGGFLIYPDFVAGLDRVVLQSSNFFKKYEYKKPTLAVANNQILLNTDLGELPIEVSDKEILNDIEGARLFCQQLGVMEDEFYDALSTWG